MLESRFQCAEKFLVGSVQTIFRPFGWKAEMLHLVRTIVPQKAAVVQPSVFHNVLRVSTEFMFSDHVVVFPYAKGRFGNHWLIQFFCPTEDLLREWLHLCAFMVEDQGGEQGVLIDIDAPAAAEPSDDGDWALLETLAVDQFVGFA